MIFIKKNLMALLQKRMNVECLRILIRFNKYAKGHHLQFSIISCNYRGYVSGIW